MDLNASDGIQIGLGVVLTLTLLAVLWYAWEARKQAKASVRMAEEMEQTRFATAKPIIELRPKDFDSTEGLNIALGGPPPTNLECRLRNVGVGPALNVVIPIRMNHDIEGTRREDVLQPDEESGWRDHVALDMKEGEGVARVFYEDVFGNRWESRYRIFLSEEKWQFGPLQIVRREPE